MNQEGEYEPVLWQVYGREASSQDALTTTVITTSARDTSNPEATSLIPTVITTSVPIPVNVGSSKDMAAQENNPGQGFTLIDNLPPGWGDDDDRGELYAVPLITVASVCLALLIVCFIVM